MAALKRFVEFPVIWFALVGVAALCFANDKLWPFEGESTITIESVDIAQPQLSLAAGYLAEAQDLNVTAVDAEIWYRELNQMDVFRPSEGLIRLENGNDIPNRYSLIPTSYKWKNPLGRVPKAQVVQTMAVQGGKSSPVQTHTYFVGIKHQLPIISLAFEGDSLFGSEAGIYVKGAEEWNPENYTADAFTLKEAWWDAPGNYHQRGKSWERPVHVEYFDEQGHRQFAFNGGVRINGNATRAFPQKSLRLYTRARYGNDTLDYSVYRGEGHAKFVNLILRNGGNDWDRTMFRDGLAAAIMKPMNIDFQRYQPVVVYMNGEYWGIHNIRERFNESHFAILAGVPESAIQMLEKNSEIYHGEPGVDEAFIGFLNEMQAADPTKAVFLVNAQTHIDLDNFVDYVLAECWLGNTDWPGNNVKYWRTTNPEGRWRWVLYDTDYGLGYTHATAYNVNMFAHLKQSGSHISQLFYTLLRSKEFQTLVEQRANFMLEHCTSPSVSLPILEKMKQTIVAEMPNQIVRWRQPSTMNEWEANCAVMVDYLNQRNTYFKQHLEAELANY